MIDNMIEVRFFSSLKSLSEAEGQKCQIFYIVFRQRAGTTGVDG